MRFAILGAGAIGCLYGARLTLAGFDVTLIHRNASNVRAIQKNGITLEEIDGETSKLHMPIRKGPVSLHNTDVVIVSVKAYDTKNVARSYRSRIPRETTILSLQNGLGNVELLKRSFKSHVLAGSTSEGSLLVRPDRAMHTGKGLTTIGDLRGSANNQQTNIRDAFQKAGFRTKVSSNMQGVLWSKAIVNAAINPLTSLMRSLNGGLINSPHIQEIGLEVIEEGISVSHSSGIVLTDNPKKLWRKILLATRTNKSSMLQDLENGKKTEIRQLNAAIVSQARRCGVEAPLNRILTELVLGLEKMSKL